MESSDEMSRDRTTGDAAAEVGTVVLDQNLQLLRLTPSAKEFLDAENHGRDQPPGDLLRVVGYETFRADAEQVLEDWRPLEREFEDAGGTYYLTRIRPCLSAEDTLEGVAVTFIDITAQKRAQRERHEAGEFAEDIVDTIREGLLVLDTDLRIETASASFYEMFDVRPEETTGCLLYNLGNGQWDIPELHNLLEDVLPNNEVFNGYRVSHTFETIGERTVILNARRLDHVQKILLAIEDITERQRAETQLKALNEELEERIEQRTRQLEETNRELRRQMSERRRLEREVLQVSEEERWRIGESLHEGAGQTLTGVHMLINEHIRKLKEDGFDKLSEVEHIRDLIKEVDDQLLHLARGIIPLNLSGSGSLRRSLVGLAGDIEERYDMKCTTRIDRELSFGSDERATHIYRILQEAVHNAALYGEASEAVIELRAEGSDYVLAVTDDGSGLVDGFYEMSATGLGHRLIRYRCRLLHGELTIEESKAGGMRVVCTFPAERSSRIVGT